ncbi:MAG: amidohydrolase [Hyphococcus sp.]|nr:MAG: amidohydrolase [Marinicaulis sp.]
MMKSTMKSVLLGVSACVAMSASAFAQTVAIMNGDVHTISGNVIEDGDVIIRNGRIAQVGADLTAPSDATVIDASGKVVTPGLFAPYSSIGLVEIGADQESNDSYPEGGFSLGAALDATDAYNPSSTLIPINRAGGITRALSTPSAGDTLFGGNAAVIDMSGRVNSIMKPAAAQVLVMGYGGAARAGDTRMGSWLVLREYLDEARSYRANPNDYVRRPHEGRFLVSDLKALGPVIAGEQPLLVRIDGANDIRKLIELKNTYSLRVIVVGGSEAWRVGDALQAANIPVILDPLVNLPSQFEDLSATLENAARLHAAGVKIAFYNPPGFGAHNLRALTQQAGNAVAEGLPHDAAMAALTINPAEMFGLASRLGTLEAGKIADVVVWDGDPLEVTTQPEAVLIDGVVQDLGNRQNALMKRYRDLSRGDLPHAYRGGE